MNFHQILLLTGGIVLYRLIFNQKGKQWLIFIASLFAIFWLQPGSQIRYVDFWFPFASISIILLTYFVINPLDTILTKKNIPAFLLLFFIPLGLSFSKYLPQGFLITATLPPQTSQVFLCLVIIIAICFAYLKLNKYKRFPLIQLGLVIGIFIILKNADLQALTISLFRKAAGLGNKPLNTQNFGLTWLGFSYIAFRLIHTLRDFQNHRLEPTDIITYFNYVLFFPALTAGPIDRIQNFLNQLKKETFFPEDLFKGGTRLAMGLVKKYAIADTLAIFSINQTNIMFVKSSAWLWLMLFSFSLMIYFDFSGYTDIALGMSRLLGISLPENFNSPYLARNLTEFWNRWHMTLTQWIRSYFFFPLTRYFRSRNAIKSDFILNSIPQLLTMIIIGFWHGISPNFLVWGGWHGIGLILHTQWNNWMRKIGYSHSKLGRPDVVVTAATTALTFMFVSIGWIWFVIPNVQTGVNLIFRLFGR